MGLTGIDAGLVVFTEGKRARRGAQSRMSLSKRPLWGKHGKGKEFRRIWERKQANVCTGDEKLSLQDD